MRRNIVGSQCSQSCAPSAKLSPWTQQQLLNHLFLHTPSNTMAKHSGYQSGKKREEFLHFSWDLLERLHDTDLHRLGPYLQLSRAPCDALACQIDLIHVNVSLQYIQQYCITM